MPRRGQLLIGAMTWSAKAGDLRRDARYVLHSVPHDGPSVVPAQRLQRGQPFLSLGDGRHGTDMGQTAIPAPARGRISPRKQGRRWRPRH